jgi:uncharacterized lipoprotein YmbA
LKKPIILLAMLAGLFALAGCASTPNVYYTLSPVSSPAPPLAAATKLKIGPYSLAAVSVPPQVDEAPLIVRMADNRLMLLTHDRWTAPLGELIHSALSQNLAQELGMPPVSNLGMTDGLVNVTRVRVDVQRFDMVPGQFVDLDSVWEVRSSEARARPVICFTRLRQSVDVGVAPLVTAQQANIARLATEIAAVLSTGKPNPQATVTCQVS